MNHRYILLYKPYRVLCQFQDQEGRSTLKDYVPIPDIYPAGRLDYDSEGLVLLTNDGWLQHCLTDPRYGHPRTYWVQVEGEPNPAALTELAEGVVVQGYRTRPAVVQVLEQEPSLPPREPPIRYRRSIPTHWLSLTLREGRNRQVRRMTAAVGLPTLRLVRVAIANLQLSGLAPGEWREVLPQERQTLWRACGRRPPRLA
ncbi:MULTISPECIES: pseudouridine synthase [unclassified Thermosynechococcus]|uniref:pseudouridine synthase n=1 Tax=unclassified Thermosynechococcus TaxID=2622553 RepID=UPI002671A1E8|nr:MULTISPECIES: pseudouridine synthase [unclassified Thermosynechococcus]WKT83206.1 pseudouridine synthase [Thermosynechococcus sp. HY596]WNC62335.1 pseudouridine synthase [Thermosynechococcus sp. HY591]WNC64890.1 pseudouridine synthase [Thermosynechococcus sp. HY593]